MTAELDLSQIKAALDGVTPGPWDAAMEIDGWRAGRRTVVKAYGKRVTTVGQTRMHWSEAAEANTVFIALARTAVPELIAEVERLRRLLAERES